MAFITSVTFRNVNEITAEAMFDAELPTFQIKLVLNRALMPSQLSVPPDVTGYFPHSHSQRDRKIGAGDLEKRKFADATAVAPPTGRHLTARESVKTTFSKVLTCLDR